MDSDEDNKPNLGIHHYTEFGGRQIRGHPSAQIESSIPGRPHNRRGTEARRYPPVSSNRQASTSRANRLEPRQAYVYPQILKVSLFGYSFWLYPVGPFQFLDFGRRFISSEEDKQVQPGRGPLTSRMLGTGNPSTSNPMNRSNKTMTKESGPNDATTSQNLTSKKREKETHDDSGERQNAFTSGMSPSPINETDKNDNNYGAGAAQQPDLRVEKSNYSQNLDVASGSASSSTSGAGPSNTTNKGSLPDSRRKKVEQMNAVEMDEHFRYLCEDKGQATPKVQTQEPSRQESRRRLQQEEQTESQRQKREYEEAIKSFMDYCQALVRNDLPTDYSEDSDDEHEWLGPPISRRSRRIPQVHIDALFGDSRPRPRFPEIDVFPYENLLFISIRRHDARDYDTVRVNNVDYVFPDYCVETLSRQAAITASQTLIASIDNFCNLRVVQGLALDSFDRDFNSFLANLHQDGTIYQIGMCRVRFR